MSKHLANLFSSYILALVLGLALVGMGCDSRVGGSGGTGDDDESGDDDGNGNNLPGDDDDDDDDSNNFGDDDDDDDDDDDGGPTFELDAISFGIEFEATPVADSATDITAVFSVQYWAEYDEVSQILNCEQKVEIAGTADFAPGILAGEGCNNCTGSINFDYSSAVDVTNPATNPDDCDVAELDANGANFGLVMMTPIADGGMGDFLTLGLVDATTMSSQGLELTVDGGYSAAEIEQSLSDYGLEFTHAGFVNNTPGTLSNEIGIDQVSAAAGPGSSWYGYWEFFKNAEDNPYVGTDLSGTYGGQAIWLIGFE